MTISAKTIGSGPTIGRPNGSRGIQLEKVTDDSFECMGFTRDEALEAAKALVGALSRSDGSSGQKWVVLSSEVNVIVPDPNNPASVYVDRVLNALSTAATNGFDVDEVLDEVRARWAGWQQEGWR